MRWPPSAVMVLALLEVVVDQPLCVGALLAWHSDRRLRRPDADSARHLLAERRWRPQRLRRGRADHLCGRNAPRFVGPRAKTRNARARELPAGRADLVGTPGFRSAAPLSAHRGPVVDRRVFRGGFGVDRNRCDGALRARRIAAFDQLLAHIHALGRRPRRCRSRGCHPAAAGFRRTQHAQGRSAGADEGFTCRATYCRNRQGALGDLPDPDGGVRRGTAPRRDGALGCLDACFLDHGTRRLLDQGCQPGSLRQPGDRTDGDVLRAARWH